LEQVANEVNVLWGAAVAKKILSNITEHLPCDFLWHTDRSPKHWWRRAWFLGLGVSWF